MTAIATDHRASVNRVQTAPFRQISDPSFDQQSNEIDRFDGFDRLAPRRPGRAVRREHRRDRRDPVEHTRIWDGSEVVVAAVLTLDRPVWQPGRIVRRVRKHSHDVRLAYAVGPDRHIGWKVSPR